MSIKFAGYIITIRVNIKRNQRQNNKGISARTMPKIDQRAHNDAMDYVFSSGLFDELKKERARCSR